jgi:hypothetical protein
LGWGGCVFGSSPKRLEQPHPQLVHWWLLVHSSHFDDRTTRSRDNEKKHEIWTPKWTTKKTKVPTPYENNWGE